jgi:hypothetical protein
LTHDLFKKVLTQKFKAMKTKVVTLMITLILSAALVYAGNKSDKDPVVSENARIEVELNIDNQTTATLKIVKIPGEKMRVTLRSETGEYLYTRRVKKYGWADITLDLRNLPVGKYEVEVIMDGNEIYSQTIEKNPAYLSFIAE